MNGREGVTLTIVNQVLHDHNFDWRWTKLLVSKKEAKAWFTLDMEAPQNRDGFYWPFMLINV